MNTVTPIVKILIIINAALFLIDSMLLYDLNGVLGLYLPEHKNFAVWQYITSMFMHGSVVHILFNMMGLWMFGSAIEKALGSKKFIIFYFIAGISAGVIANVFNSYQYDTSVAAVQTVGMFDTAIMTLLDTRQYIPLRGLTGQMVSDLYQNYHIRTVGASGAIYGVIAAFAILYPNAKMQLLFIPFPVAAKYFVPALLSLDVFSSITGLSLFGSNIAHTAHLGGALTGFLLILYWRRKK